jgi:hypothetical protein
VKINLPVRFFRKGDMRVQLIPEVSKFLRGIKAFLSITGKGHKVKVHWINLG